jgi:hypothetical protein
MRRFAEWLDSWTVLHFNPHLPVYVRHAPDA